MNLTEALRINNAIKNSPNSLTVYLATGFTPLSLSPFLAAHLSNRIAECRINVTTGAFGDLAGNIRRIAQLKADLAAICVEWDDLDPRLGVRRVTGVTWKDFPEILAHARSTKDHLVSLILEASAECRAAVSLPHIPIPPLSHSPTHIIDGFEAELRLIIAEMQAELAGEKDLSVIRLESSECFDLSAALHSGFPYSTKHAAEVGGLFAAALVAAASKKGIIIDLDDTLWKGILGEEGIDGVHWDLDHSAQHHGLFQQFLHALAAEGTLVAIASKNSPGIVHEMFARRSTLLLKAEDVFPMEVHWGPKSESVARILKAWNVSADSLVFIDDNPLELAEVESAHPEISCRLFPKQDLIRFENLLRELREMFAKERVGEEDALRTASLRTNAHLFSGADWKSDPEVLLRDLNAEITLDLSTDASDERALELINKTNQFNLNGARIAQPLWRKSLARPGAFLMTCAYIDKFGSLGKIAAITGIVEIERVVVESWVMSCRAFARRIEFACLQQLFQHFSAVEVVLKYRRTERNGPVKELLEFFGAEEQDSAIVLSRDDFSAKLPKLYHHVVLNSKRSEVETYV